MIRQGRLVNQPTLMPADAATAVGGTTSTFLGAGTFGETWRVDGVLIDGEPRSVAVKFLQPHNFHPGLVEREIAGLTDISSRRIMGLHEVRTISIADTDYTALLCEYLPGGSVEDNLAADGVPGHVDAVAFAIELLHAVAQLHAAERVHRDLKPENIMLRDGSWASPVLIDLGLSKAATEMTMTRYPQRVGSLLFMAPEQLRGERARKSSDLWACGVILFTVLTGQHPYITSLSGKTEDEVAEEITGPPRALPAHIPDALHDVVLRLLSEDAFERGTAKRALKDLRKAAK
ncbi:serine/threonine protein kinase [Curtobacterium sp. PhB171]|nr:serine/threonine protein kinase [Curtobacterium sp. PhB171]ROQ22354.1 serine/threonine protein kinase [Curtobacterium sp. PhB170]ROS65032.1 serine/threonine protein kinase [Curtobacterium sp. PhB141]